MQTRKCRRQKLGQLRKVTLLGSDGAQVKRGSSFLTGAWSRWSWGSDLCHIESPIDLATSTVFANNRRELIFPGDSDGKECTAMQEAWVRSLGQEDPLEKEMAIHSNILAWEIPWTEESGGLQSMGSKRVGYLRATNTHTYA